MRHLSGAAIARELASIDRNLTLFNAQSMRDYLASLSRVAQRGTAFASGVGAFGLLLAYIGRAGVTEQAVGRRRKEIGGGGLLANGGDYRLEHGRPGAYAGHSASARLSGYDLLLSAGAPVHSVDPAIALREE
jgi:hypothetical protein